MSLFVGAIIILNRTRHVGYGSTPQSATTSAIFATEKPASQRDRERDREQRERDRDRSGTASHHTSEVSLAAVSSLLQPLRDTVLRLDAQVQVCASDCLLQPPDCHLAVVARGERVAA